VRKQLNVVDFRVALRIDRLAQAPRQLCQRVDIGQLDRLALVRNEKEPVSAPCNIAFHWTKTRDIDDNLPGLAVARYIGNADRAIGVQLRIYRTDRRVDAVGARCKAPHVCERRNQPDGSVPAHAEVADIVEKDHAQRAIRPV
jgi:hypothetical protein